MRALPGYGKTVLAKSFARDLKNGAWVRSNLPDFTEYTTLAYFFREDSSAGTTLVAFLRSVLHQILLQCPALGPHIQQVFSSANNITPAGRSVDPCLMPEVLWRAFQSVLHNRLLSKVVLVIDGLDEANVLDVRDICSGLLQTIDSLGNAQKLKVFVTSRDSHVILEGFKSCNLVETLEITPEHTQKDIETFLANATTGFAAEHNVPDNDIERIKEQISRKADGMFLWASLAWDHFKGGVAIWSGRKVQERLQALESLPPGLYALYKDLIQKIDQDVLEGLLAVFLVVAAAARPLACEEAEQILGIKGWETRTTDLDIPFSIRAVINIHCANLLNISPAGVIRAVHLSLKDFIRVNLLNQQASALHSKIARDCIHYLTLADVRETALEDVRRTPTESCLMQRFGFYDYAATYLRHHMKHVESDDHVWIQYGSMIKHYAAFHTAMTSMHSSHINKLDMAAPSYYAETPLRHAIRLHGTGLIRTFRNSSYNLDERVWDYAGEFVVEAGTAIHCYITKNDVLTELLSCGASPNVRDFVERTALHVAVRRGARQAVKLLLSSNDINVNAQDAEGRTALHYEATSGHGSLLLSDQRVEVDIRDNIGRTAITSAAFWGDRQTTIDFLRSRRNVMAQHEGELSLLIAAAQQGWLDITLEVLAQLTDVTEHRGYDRKTILHWAVINDWEDVLIRAITQAHARVNERDSRMRTPLHEAAEYGNAKLARKLIAHGASARSRDHQGRTPVQLAAIEGFSDTVQALLNSDFDINDADLQQRTFVHWAASWDWTIIMRHVIEDPDANLFKHDCMGRTALHVAALCGCPNVLKLLIREHTLDVNEMDSFGNTLLHLAARGRSLSVVDVLLLKSHFTKVHAVNNHGQTALDVAIAYGAEEVERRLRMVPLSTQKEVDWGTRNKPYYQRDNFQVMKFHHKWKLVPYVPSRETLPSPETPSPPITRPSSPLSHAQPNHQPHRNTPDADGPPVFVRYSSEYLSPETLDLYGLSWRWDSSFNYIIMQDVSPELWDELFEHTKNLRRRRRSRSKSRTRVRV